MLLVEGVLSPSQCPGDTVPKGCARQRGRRGSRGHHWRGAHVPFASTGHSCDLSLLQRWMGEEREVSAPHPHRGWEQTLNPGAPWAAHPPSSHFPGVPVVSPAWCVGTGMGKAAAGAGALSPRCVSAPVSA